MKTKIALNKEITLNMTYSDVLSIKMALLSGMRSENSDSYKVYKRLLDLISNQIDN